MMKVFGRAIYEASRRDGVLHISARGEKPNIQTKVTIEQLPFLIWPPEFGLFFEEPGIVSPMIMPFDVEQAFPSYPRNPNYVAIRDATGLHHIDVQDVAPSPVHPLLEPSTAAEYVVYRQLTVDRFLIAKVGQFVPTIYTKVFGPATLEQCQAYVSEHTPTPTVDLIPGTLKAWINRMPGPSAATLHAQVQAFVHLDWTVEIVEAVPPGINPADLLLKLKVTIPSTPLHPGSLAARTLTFVKEVGHASYASVTIENGKDTMSAPVEIVE